MVERDKTGTKAARANFPNSPACGQWETLLVDAMDGLLKPEDESTFSGHMATCEPCAEMFEQVRRGREWLEFLAPEPEVPSYLLDRILMETGPGKMDSPKLAVAGGAGAVAGNVVTMPHAWQRPGLAGRVRRFAEPRLLMTAAMAFFSIALTMSLTGVRISAVKMSDLRPAALYSAAEKRIMTASTPIVRYYDHLRFVYEVESRMKELRRSSETAQPAQPKNKSNGTGGEGETEKKDGGTRLNPNEAPQQTVNPPSSLWSGEVLEAKLRLKPRNDRQNHTVVFNNKTFSPAMGLSTLTQVSGVLDDHLVETGLLTKSVLAMPERSKSCLA